MSWATVERKTLRIATMILRAGGSELVAVCAHDFGDQGVGPQQAKFALVRASLTITARLFGPVAGMVFG